MTPFFKPEKETNSFSDSAELFDSIFKEATQEIDKSKVEKPKPEKPAPAPGAAPVRRKAVTPKKPPEPEKKPIKPLLATARQPGKPEPPLLPQKRKPAAKKKARKGSNIVKLSLMVVLLAILGGFLANYFGIVDISKIPDLLGLGGQEVAQAPPPKKQPANTPGKPAGAPVQKKAGEQIALAKKGEPKPATPKPVAPAPSGQPPVKKEEPRAPAQPRMEPAKVEAPPPSAQVQPSPEGVK